MGLTRTIISPAAGDDGAATWAQGVYNDIGSLIDYKLVYTESDAATITFNMNNSAIQLVTLGGNRTLAVSNVTDGQTFIIILKQDATGSRVPTWWSGIQWPYNIVPTLTTTANKYDIFSFTRIGSIYLGNTVNQCL